MVIRQIFQSTFILPLAISSLIILPALPSPAQAQDWDPRLSRIENDIETLSRAVFKGEKLPPGAALPGASDDKTHATTELRLQQIERDLRTLTGKLEQEQFDARQTQSKLEKQISDLESRLQTMEANRASASMPPYRMQLETNSAELGAAADSTLIQNDLPSYDAAPVAGQLGTLRQPADQPLPPGAEVIGTANTPLSYDGPVDMYEHAFSFLRDRQYDEAEKAFKAFLDQYEDHELAPNAKYWLGETYYVRQNFPQAARVFAEAYQRYPQGPKGPDNLLKLGMSLSGMGKTKESCVTYDQLQKEYPDGAPPIMTRAKQEIEKLGCDRL